MEFIINFFEYLVPFFLLLGTLVFIHELGHYLAARYYGVRVEVFSLGFGPKLFGFKWGDTYYCISLIPFGGYVKMFGDNPKQKLTVEEKKEAFLSQKVWPKSAIALAGPVMNFVIAVILFMMVGFIGREKVLPYVGDLTSDSVAYTSGFRPDDLIVSVNQEPISFWEDVHKKVQSYPLQELAFQVKRQDQMHEVLVTPDKVRNEQLSVLSRYVGKIEGLSGTSQSAHIGVKDHSSLAYKHGLRTFDEIKKINNTSIYHWRGLEREIQSIRSKELNIQVKREGENELVPIHIPITSSVSLSHLGIENTHLYLDRVKKDSPAAKAGLMKGDRLFSVEGLVLSTWDDFSDLVKKQKSNRFEIVILRDGKEKSVSIQAQEMPIIHSDGELEHRYMIGIASAQYISFSELAYSRITNPFRAFSYGLTQTLKWVGVTGKVLWNLITGSISHRVLGGPLSIAKVAKNSFFQSIAYFLSVMAIISVNLFLMNLLPIPILDGGHLLLFAIEGIRGGALSVQRQELVQLVGLAIVLFFIVLTLVNDVRNWNIIW